VIKNPKRRAIREQSASHPGSIALGALVWLILCAPAFGRGLEAMKFFVRLRFWEVPGISTKDLARWLKDDSRPKPFLVDVRTPAEYAVSHLPGAHRIDPAVPTFQTLDQLPLDRPIVTYCSVGYRSAELAQRLIAAGRRNIYNMEGSIFQWANEGRPLERDGKPVDTVHPYNDNWGIMLDLRRRAKVQPVE
jgi:rhodanese-related sulfurtransferase